MIEGGHDEKSGSLGSNEANGENKLSFGFFVCFLLVVFYLSVLDSTMKCSPSGIPHTNVWRVG